MSPEMKKEIEETILFALGVAILGSAVFVVAYLAY